MPAALAWRGTFEPEHGDSGKERRKDILRRYPAIAGDLPVRSFLPSASFDKRRDIAPLRFLFTRPDAEKLHGKMDRHLQVIGRLYPQVLSTKNVEERGYIPGSCPVSEKICERVINWPCSIAPGKEKQIMEIFAGVFAEKS